MTEAIKSTFIELWNSLVNYVTASFTLDPFWSWLVLLIGLYVVVMVICYFFGTYWPILRVIGGVLLIIATAGLFAYAKGERDARAYDKARAPKPRPKPKPLTHW